MRKLIILEHTSLDGFAAGSKGEMDWIRINEEMFDLVGTFTSNADTALYGRVTYEMMDQYWPTAADQPDASKHDIEHSHWYNSVNKVVLSKTLQKTTSDKTIFISENVPDEIDRLKQQPGKNILMIGSPTSAHTLMQYNLIDEYWIFVNPIILGQGIPFFANTQTSIKLKLLHTTVFPCGVTALNYAVER